MIEKTNLWVDLFAGAGGLSTGAHLEGKKVIACVNHDEMAIASHKENHPETVHLIEDIKDRVVIPKLKSLINGRPFNLWASLECTSFSTANCKRLKNSSRTLGFFLLNYVKHLQPESVWIENVPQFVKWTKLDKNGRPIKSRLGEYYDLWKHHMNKLGYEYCSNNLNGKDFGSFQSRKRYFAQFKKKKEFIWPEPTHGEDEGLLPYKRTLDFLELQNLGQSIFTRKKPYKESTLRRLYEGLEKFHDDDVFLDEYYGNGRAQDAKLPIPVITTKDRYDVVHKIKSGFLDQQYGNGSAASLLNPVNTLTTNPKIEPCFIFNPQYGSKGSSIHRPLPTVIARQDKAPLGLISKETNGPDLTIKESDSHYTKLIKQFCIDNGISDIRKRPLTITELKRAQGFPDDYILKGTKTQQKKFIGNAVDVTMARALMSVA